jgi:hypothetical protein
MWLFGTREVDIGTSWDELWEKTRSLFGILKCDISTFRKVIIWKISDNSIFHKMKNDLTTGTWQDNIWCPINIILLCTSDVDNWSSVGDVVGDNDNGSPSPSRDNGFEVGQLNDIEPRDVAAVGNVGGGHAINNNHCDVAVVNNVGNNEFVNNSCATGPDINIGDWMGVVDVIAALNSDPCDVAILQQHFTSLQQPEIVDNTIINNENQEQGGDDSADNATGWARENPDTGHQITTRASTGKVAGYNELETEDCPGLASVPTSTYLREQLALRDAKIVAMEQSISQLIHTVMGLQQRWWKPVLIINMPDIQWQFEPLGSYTMNRQEYNDKWGCTLTTNDESWFSGGGNDGCNLKEIKEDNTTPRDGQSQQYNDSTPQTRGTRRKKIRNEEEWIVHPVTHVQSTKHPEGNTTAEKGFPYYKKFSKSWQRNIHDTDSDSHADAGLQNSDVICHSNSILQVIASCTHLTEFYLSPPSKEHQSFRLYYKFANVIHSKITGGPDVVNPYNFVDIFKSYWKRFDTNECTYILDIVALSYCSVILYCCIVVLFYCDIIMFVIFIWWHMAYCHIVVLLYFVRSHE